MKRTEIKNLIAQAKLREAIDLLSEQTKRLSKEENDEAIFYQFQYRRIKEAHLNGAISNEKYNLELNKLSRSLIDFINEIDTSEKEQIKFKGNLKQILGLLRDGKLEEAISSLTSFSKKYPKDIQDELLLLNSRLNIINKDYRLGTIENEVYFINKAKITNQLLSILKSIEEIQVEVDSKKISIEKVRKSIKNSYLSVVVAFIGTVASLIGSILSIQNTNVFSSIDQESLLYLGISFIGLISLLVIVQIIVDRKRKEKADEILLRNQLTDLYLKALDNSSFNPNNEYAQ